MPDYVIATDCSVCDINRVAVGAIVWQSVCSQQSGVKMIWFGKKFTSSGIAELMVIERALSIVPKYSCVTLVMDQEQLLNIKSEDLKKFRNLVRDGTPIREHKRLIDAIFQHIQKRSLSVYFMKSRNHPFYRQAHRVANSYLRKFSPLKFPVQQNKKSIPKRYKK